MKEFISILFQNKKDNEEFNIQDDELNEWKEKLERTKQELHKFSSKRIHPKFERRFYQIIFELEEATVAISDIENELYYKAGVKDGAKISKTIQE